MEFPFWHNQLFQFMLCSLMLFILPQLHPNGTYTSYEISTSEELVGPYAENSLINNAEQLHLGLLKGPETLVVLNNILYTGIHGGDVVRIVGNDIQPVTKFGVDCDGQWQESKCGRPFGLATDNIENLFVADAYYGIWQYNVKTGSRQVLVPHNVSIDGRVPKTFNSLAVSPSGDIYWTDSSADVDIQNGVFAMFMDGSGRLFKYDAEKNESYVLADELYFPTGIALSPKEDFVVVSEMITSRLLRHYISGPKKGMTEVFLDRIPGFPDRLKVHGNYIMVALVHARDASQPVFFQRISSYTLVRRAIVHTMAYAENVFKFLNRYFPTEMFEKIIHKIGHFETVSGFAPKRVTILIVDWDGNVVESWHNTDGTLTAVGDVQIYNGHVYYGSPYNMYIGRTPMPKTNLTFEKQRPKPKTIVLEL